MFLLFYVVLSYMKPLTNAYVYIENKTTLRTKIFIVSKCLASVSSRDDEVTHTTLSILNILQTRMNDYFFEYFRTLHPYYGKPIKHLFL